MKHKPLDDLELYELLVAAYPERFDANSEDDLWYEVMDFASEMFANFNERNELDNISDLLGRVVMLTNPMQSAISKHPVSISGDQVNMVSAVSRKVELTDIEVAA